MHDKVLIHIIRSRLISVASSHLLAHGSTHDCSRVRTRWLRSNLQDSSPEIIWEVDFHLVSLANKRRVDLSLQLREGDNAGHLYSRRCVCTHCALTPPEPPHPSEVWTSHWIMGLIGTLWRGLPSNLYWVRREALLIGRLPGSLIKSFLPWTAAYRCAVRGKMSAITSPKTGS